MILWFSALIVSKYIYLGTYRHCRSFSYISYYDDRRRRNHIVIAVGIPISTYYYY